MCVNVSDSFDNNSEEVKISFSQTLTAKTQKQTNYTNMY